MFSCMSLCAENVLSVFSLLSVSAEKYVSVFSYICFCFIFFVINVTVRFPTSLCVMK